MNTTIAGRRYQGVAPMTRYLVPWKVALVWSSGEPDLYAIEDARGLMELRRMLHDMFGRSGHPFVQLLEPISEIRVCS